MNHTKQKKITLWIVQQPIVPCDESEFTCADGLLCINVTLQCDGYYDCKDFSDEQNCFG